MQESNARINFNFDFKINFKSVGQECPTHTAKPGHFVALNICIYRMLR